MVMAQSPQPMGVADPDLAPEESRRAEPGDVFYRHWRWFAFRAGLVIAGSLVLFALSLAVLGGMAWVVFLLLLLVTPAVCYGLFLAWRVVTIEVDPDKLLIKEGFIRTRRVSIPVLNVQEYEQLYRSDLDRVLFHCVELRITMAGEEPNPAFYPLNSDEAACLTRFLDVGRKERPSDPVVRLQRQSLDTMERLTALMIITAERLGARLEVIERALEMADRGESPDAITRFVYAAQRGP
jgi:membrane protein YdbS with pleckstrin-like domain